MAEVLGNLWCTVQVYVYMSEWVGGWMCGCVGASLRGCVVAWVRARVCA
jgi:hypothetical protein